MSFNPGKSFFASFFPLQLCLLKINRLCNLKFHKFNLKKEGLILKFKINKKTVNNHKVNNIETTAFQKHVFYV